MEIKIDLNNPSATETVNVELQWNVDVLEPKPGFLPKLFRRHNQVERELQLSITDLVVPDEIVCDKSKLFSILYHSQIIPQAAFPVDILLTEMSMPFQLLFHQKEITDCKRPQGANPRRYTISFSVALLDGTDIISTMTEDIHITFVPLNVKPKFRIHLPEENIQYTSALKKQEVGLLAIWLEEPFLFTPDQLAAIDLKLYKGTQECSQYISFTDDTASKTLIVKRDKKNVISLPVFVDFTYINNPIGEKEDYTIEATIVTSPAYSPEIKETSLIQQHFKLLKDQQGTELKIFVKRSSDKKPVLCDGAISSIPVSMSFVPRSRLSKQISVIISNIATDNSNPQAGLYIKNLTLTENIQNEVAVIGEGNKYITHFINMDGPDISDMNSTDGLFIPNKENAQTLVNISFNPSAIADLQNSKNYDFQIQSVLTFDYWEDKDGMGVANAQKKTGRVPIIWNLDLKPNPEWLCVDYGSSAIVCKYDQQIINLKKRKDTIFRTADDGRFRLDTTESDTPFLSSDIVLHTVRANSHSTLCSQQAIDAEMPYLNLSVCLSPTSSLIHNDVKTQLPCLKILVGNELLPKKPDFWTFKYTRLDDKNNIETIEAKEALARNEDTCILRISAIFKEAYAALFRYFILPESKEKSINKLVLTYPNTYTPVHLKVLEKIARQTFPKVREGYLRFVSESDAVAAYYLKNWDSFNKGKNINDTETVLVYDMGAGTLDLTLFKKYKNTDGKIAVDILGKIGTGKAGNYLDFLISEIIKDKVAGVVSGDKIVSTQAVPDVQTLHKRLELKEAVKNIIKPKLKTGTTIECLGHSIDSAIILSDKRFTDYLQQVTSGIIKQLLAYINNKSLTIDTVLMSGRSCRLGAIQESLKIFFNKKTGHGTRVLKFHCTGDEEKTAVVEGAMAQAGIFSSPESAVIIRSKRLYASYGLVFQKLGGTYHYAELINCADLPYTEHGVLKDFEGQAITVSGTANTTTLKLVQTYLSAKDTEAAYNAGDMEFISEMEEYDMAGLDGVNTLNVRLMIDYKNNISLYVNGLCSIGNTPQGVDLSSEITKRSIWPVTL